MEQSPPVEDQDNPTSQITAEMFPENTVTVILKYKGKLYTKGGMLSDPTDSAELYRTLARVRLLLHGMQLTIFHTLGGHSQDENMDLWYRTRRAKMVAADVKRGIEL